MLALVARQVHIFQGIGVLGQRPLDRFLHRLLRAAGDVIAAGVAHAIAGLLKALPAHAARGQLFVPLEILERHGAGRRDVVGGRATPQLRAALGELRRCARGHLDAARALIVEGAVGMVEHALDELAKKGLVDFEPERKAAMVSNLMVVLCGHNVPQPVLNTGTLYN